MKKAVFILVLAMVLVFSLAAFTACSGGGNAVDPTTSDNTTTPPTTNAPNTPPTTTEPTAPPATTEPTTTPPTTTEPTTTPPTTTEPTTTPPTTTEPTTSTPPTTTEPTTEPPDAGGDPPVITAHAVGAGYDGLCLICHMIGGTDPVPDDHADRTPDMCLQEGCHTAA